MTEDKLDPRVDGLLACLIDNALNNPKNAHLRHGSIELANSAASAPETWFSVYDGVVREMGQSGDQTNVAAISTLATIGTIILAKAVVAERQAIQEN